VNAIRDARMGRKGMDASKLPMRQGNTVISLPGRGADAERREQTHEPQAAPSTSDHGSKHLCTIRG
jgi:hypothetical protein